MNLFGYELSFGRAKKQPERTTSMNTSMFGILGNGFGRQQTVKKPNAKYLRRFARTSIPRRAINIIKDGILALDYKIVPINPEDKTDYAVVSKMVDNIIRTPNDYETYKSFWGAILEDTLVGDCGCAEVVKAGQPDKPLYLFAVDGFTMEFVDGWTGQPNMPRYAQIQNMIKKIFFFDNDIIYVKKNSFSDTPFGLSPLESAFTYIDYLLNSHGYANSVAGRGLPKFILNLGENLSETQIEQFKRYLEEDIYGSGSLPVVGGTKGIGSHQIGAINDDGLYLKWMSLLTTIISFTFGVDPKKLGEGSATDRSTIQEQNENVLNEAIKPYAGLLEDIINQKILARLGLDKVLRFQFIYEETLEQKQAKTNILISQFNADAISQNEMRKELGYLPRDSKYAELTISELKASINKDYQIQGGFNGVGKDRKENTTPKGGDNQDE